MKNKKIISVFIFILFSVLINAQILTVEISNIRNTKGNICFAVFSDKSGFQKEKPYINKSYSKSNVKNGKLIVQINIKPGIYGISILDDENKNGKMEYNRIRIPKEGFGFSNYYHKGLMKPKFKDFEFEIKDKDISVKVKMKYI